VREVLDLVGLSEVARKRAGGFSLGMGQRLGMAAALLGDPQTLILDEPANGLDPEGILWIRNLLKGLAAEGRTIFVSSHLMAEMAQTAERLVIIGRGRLIADTTVAEVLAQASHDAAVNVRTPQAARLQQALRGDGVLIRSVEPDHLEIEGLSSAEVGETAARNGIVLHELVPQKASLEEAFMRLTGGEIEFHAGVLGEARVDDKSEVAA
jgi:ABC-2 type transport system ATP-binding protein